MKSVLTILLVFQAVTGFTQIQFHVDPNKVQPTPMLMAAGNASGNSNQIVIANSYSKQLAILVSDDKSKWDTAIINGSGNLTYTCSSKYVRIYSSKGFNTYRLNGGYTYTLTWDSAKNMWTLQ